MSKFYRKKPIVIEAFQMTEQARQDIDSWPAWLMEAWCKDHSELGALYPEDFPDSDGRDRLRIMTLEGNQLVSFDDWIIRGIHGEIYPCKPDIFEKTYEESSRHK
jgi:hypothetical protein